MSKPFTDQWYEDLIEECEMYINSHRTMYDKTGNITHMEQLIRYEELSDYLYDRIV